MGKDRLGTEPLGNKLGKGTIAVSKKKGKGYRDASTSYGRMIQELMTSSKRKGNYRDYIVISGDRLIDWLGEYPLTVTGQPKGGDVRLLHKRELARVIGVEVAKEFWWAGCRVNNPVYMARYKAAIQRGDR